MPNAPLDLDPSLRDLLRNLDMTIAHRFNAHYPEEPPDHRHMELAKQKRITPTNWIEEEGARFQGVAQVPPCGVWDGVRVSEDNIGSGNRQCGFGRVRMLRSTR
jgi:hypothetical protein